jgi:hypothetical protein
MARKAKCSTEKLYGIVENLHNRPKQNSRNKGKYNFSDPTALRALRIHRHLRALEQDILDHAGAGNGKPAVSMQVDSSSKQIVISIRNDEVHCSRVAYLSSREFSLLRKNRKVANVLRKLPAWKDVA